jgi:hypothetical protein
MALPPENRTPRMEMLETIVARTPREKLMDFPVLEPADLVAMQESDRERPGSHRGEDQQRDLWLSCLRGGNVLEEQGKLEEALKGLPRRPRATQFYSIGCY